MLTKLATYVQVAFHRRAQRIVAALEGERRQRTVEYVGLIPLGAVRLYRTPETVVSIADVLADAEAGVIAYSGREADGPNVNCGDAITSDTTLHHDLSNRPNSGILKGADTVTLNLNGHTIDGD